MEEQKTEAMPQEERTALPEQERDFEQEVRALFAARPELQGGELPDEVVLACIRGQGLQEAYSDYAGRQRRDAAALRQENRVLRQNAQAASRGPVRGVTRGGGAHTGPEDAFLRGFNQDW